MRVVPFAKLFFFCSILVLLVLVYMCVKDSVTKGYINKIVGNMSMLSNESDIKLEINKTDMKYILQWTSARNVPFVYMGVGQEGFISRHCPYTNCIVTSDRNLLGGVTKFDVIAFSGPEVIYFSNHRLPAARSPRQKYVFASIESSHYYPVCSNRFNGFFNWTWTFRLDSVARWGYMLIRNSNDEIIGPNKIMHWIKLEDMDPVSDEFKKQLTTKKKAAAWFVSNCFDRSGRVKLAKDLNLELKKYELAVDIYGKCGTYVCPRDKNEECEKMLKNDYYFYLSFENSFSEDYVTEKLMKALNNDIVPIVYGGANYTRFMPDGIYLDARKLGVKKLAEEMNNLINDPEAYANYFRWKNHYSYHRQSERPETDEYCGFCTLLNNEEKVKSKSVIENFRDWWDNPKTC